MKLKKDDTVQLIYGYSSGKGKRATLLKGKQGKVLSINKEEQTVIVEGMNIHLKHVRRSQRNPQGGRLSKEMPIPISKVMLVCQKCQKPTRIGILVNSDGSKFRVCKKCGQTVSQIAPLRKKQDVVKG
ncbi:MAG: 50S ribosomal protein L24 [Planctomycetaceae bacterium]|jgi:large subunit ribosomal protein L24|nr:50S ribosomal protein L24 [Planctomycetaceae bacterium]